MNNVVEVLNRARSFIDTPEKWYKGNWSNDEGNCFCTMGAIVKALDFDISEVITMSYEDTKAKIHDHPASVALQEVLGIKEHNLGPKGSIAGWNDFVDTTHAQVMEAFDKAITKASQ